MSEIASATPRETLPVNTTSTTLLGNVSTSAWAIERSSPVRGVGVTCRTLFPAACERDPGVHTPGVAALLHQVDPFSARRDRKLMDRFVRELPQHVSSARR